MTVCSTFRKLAITTWYHLEKARRVQHQPLEETLTDINLLEIKDRHPSEIYTKTFTRPQEGWNGADWEWWLTNSAMNYWLGLRVQAKVLKLTSCRFEHLHYRKGRTYQSSKLKHAAAIDGLVPLYCLYSQWSDDDLRGQMLSKSLGFDIRDFGCSLLSTIPVDALRKESHQDELFSVVKNARPWHCLVCSSGKGGPNLPERAWSFLQNDLKIKTTYRKPRNTPQIGMRSEPPPHVRTIMKDGENAHLDRLNTKLRGIVIVRERDY